MATIPREIVEGMQLQGEDETIVYQLTTTPWGSSPTSTSAKIFRQAGGETYTDVTSTNMTGSTSVTGDVITLPAISGLTDGVMYRVEVKFTSSGNIFEAYAYIKGER